METAAPEDVACAVRYLNLTKKEGYHWGMMRGIWSSAADLAVVQAQDLLGLGHGSPHEHAVHSGRQLVLACRTRCL